MGVKGSTSQKISFHKQELPLSNFKSFNKALNKKTLFPLDRKSVSIIRNQEFDKKYISTWRKNCFSPVRETVFTRSKEVFL